MYQFRRLISTLPLLAVAGIFLISATSWIVAQAQGTLDDARQYNQEVGWLYNQGRFAEALPMAQRALEIRERILGPSHADVSQSLNTLALIYRMLGRYSEAEPLYLRSAEIDKEILGPKSGRYASVINNLGGLYRVMGRYDKAETLLRESLEIRRDVLGRNHPDYGTSLNNLALLYKDMGQYAKAEPLYLEALKISSAYGENTRAYA